ncbi:MAG: TIGR00269 family protein [Methanomassiliicoccus sp.]|nr:TIGR00269 family protein [Methanomassiliicoccus sp.]
MVQCSKCGRAAVTFIRYNGSHLCAAHFQEYVERRVKKELRDQIDLDRCKHIAVAVSGGKDSCVALHLVHDILSQRRDVTISAITVDEGIAGYRPEALDKVRKLTAELGVEHHVISFREQVGETMDTIAQRLGHRTPCAYCGVFRRQCMNLKAREIDAHALATGHNLDDVAQAVLMNFTRGDVERLARMGPHVKVQPGLVPRILPLRSIPEKEVYLYALLTGMDFADSTCPYWEAAMRNEYRDIIDGMEARSPGTKHSILASYEALRPLLQERYPQAALRLCQCGEPSPRGRCMACTMREELETRRSGARGSDDGDAERP